MDDILASVRAWRDGVAAGDKARTTAQLVVPRWFMDQVNALTPDDRATLWAEMDAYASACGFAGWEMRVLGG